MIRTTLSFTALFGLLALACNLLFTHSADKAASEGRGSTEATGTDAKGDSPSDEPLLRQTQREDSPLSLVTEPVHLKSIGQPSATSEIQLVDFEEAFFLDPPAKDEAVKSDETKSDETVAPKQSIKDQTSEEKPAEEKSSEDKPADKSADDKPIGPKEPKPLPAAKEQELSLEQVKLRDEIRECLGYYYHRPENIATRSPWACMHAMIAYGVDANLVVNGQRANAIGYLCFNGNCNGQQLFYTQGGQIQARIGPGVQGHAGQFLSMLAQSRVKTTFPMKVDGRDFTVADLVEHEKLTCRPNTELTFKLISLTHYLRSDESWTSNDGQSWDIPRLIKEELNQKIVGAACGGTHRLTGLSYSVRKRQQRGEVMEGQWLRAKKFIDAYHQYTFRLQNPDGSFSTDWFAGRADNGPPSRRLETTGHITEWLAYSLPQDELTDPKMEKSVAYLTKLLYDGRNEKWNIGPLGHGLHALAMYDERVFGGTPGKRAEQLAHKSPVTR